MPTPAGQASLPLKFDSAAGPSPSRSLGKSAAKNALRRESVRKNVAAIHVSGKLSLLQRKLSNVLLLNAYDELLSRQTHAIDARTLCVMIGYNSNDTAVLKEALRALVETRAEWDMLGDDGAQEWGVSALLASARLRGGVCEYAYSSALAEKLHDPKIFALINVRIQRKFTSGHALALYENCYRFVRTGSTGWWEIGLFRRLMGIDDSPYYANFKHLNAKIVKPAVTEVNRVSNIHLTPEVARRQRAVHQIRFLIREVTPAPDAEAEAAAGGDLQDRLAALGVSERLARQWIAEHGEAYVAEKLDYVSERSRSGKVQGSPVGYLSAAIREDYRSGVSGPESKGFESKGPESWASDHADPGRGSGRRSALRRAEARERLAALRKSHRAACYDMIAALVAGRGAEEVGVLQDRFAASVADEADREDFRRHGWRSPLNGRAIFRFWEDVSGSALPSLREVAQRQNLDLDRLAAEAGEAP